MIIGLSSSSSSSSLKWNNLVLHAVLRPKDADGMANNEDPDRTAPSLHCLLRHICPNIKLLRSDSILQQW